MSRETNVRVARAHIQAINSRDPESLLELLADGFQGHETGSSASRPRSKTQSRETLERFLGAFAEIHFEITLTVADDDYVVFHWMATGRQTADLTSPSGNIISPGDDEIRVPGSTTYEVKDAKITQTWMFWDMSTLSEFYF